MLDVSPAWELSDIAFPLLVTESIPKADAATTAWGDKLLAIGMIGVFGFRDKDQTAPSWHSHAGSLLRSMVARSS